MAKVPSRLLPIWSAVLCLGLTACSSAQTPGLGPRTNPNLVPAVPAKCAPPKTEHEDFAFEFKLGEPMWKVGYFVEYPNHDSVTEFIRKGDDINNWHELFTVQNFTSRSWGGSSPEDALNDIKAVQERRCPGVTRWNVIENKWDSILFEWQAKPCGGWPEQHEIAKIVYGKYNRFYIHYVAKVYQLSEDTRTEWMKRFAEWKIVLRCR